MSDTKLAKHQIIAETLHKVGFQVDEFQNGLLISLTSRKISTMEVDTVLQDKLDIQAGMMSVTQGVFIGTVAL
jgi:hypothetical protein